MALELGLDLIQEVFSNTLFNGSYVVIQIFVILASLVIVSREPKHWRTLALPVIMGWHIVGFRISYVLFIIAGILFVVETMSTSVLSGAIGAVGNAFGAFKGMQPRWGYKSRKEKMIKREKMIADKQWIKDKDMRKKQKDIERKEHEISLRKRGEKIIIEPDLEREEANLTEETSYKVAQQYSNKPTDLSVLSKTKKAKELDAEKTRVQQIMMGENITSIKRKLLKEEKARPTRKQINKRINKWSPFDPKKSKGGGTGKWASEMRNNIKELLSKGWDFDDAYKEVGKKYKGKFKIKRD